MSILKVVFLMNILDEAVERLIVFSLSPQACLCTVLRQGGHRAGLLCAEVGRLSSGKGAGLVLWSEPATCVADHRVSLKDS